MNNILVHLASPFTDPNRKSSTHGDSLYALDGIRGIAVLLVITSHTGAFGMHAQGSLGVFLFFTLSGFVLTLPYADNPKRLMTRSELWRFSANRVLRIVPIYIVAVLVIAWMLDADANWIVDNASFRKGWNHLWSVAEEARFYILFPMVIGIVALLPTRSARLMALFLLTWLAWRYQALHRIDLMDGRLVNFYFWLFLGGASACMIYSAPAAKKLASNRLATAVFGALALIILVFFVASSDQMVGNFWRPLFPDLPENLSLNGWRIPGTWFILFILLLLSVTLFRGTIASRFLQSWPLRHIGLLSYSLYLFHIPVIMQMRQYGLEKEGLFAAVFVISYVIALLSYVAVEKPFLMLKPESNKQTV